MKLNETICARCKWRKIKKSTDDNKMYNFCEQTQSFVTCDLEGCRWFMEAWRQ